MAGDITYVDVAMLPRERPRTPSRTSVPGCKQQRSTWFYVALALGFLVLILLVTMAVLAKQFLEGRAEKSDFFSQYGLNNTDNHVSSEKTVSVVVLKWLMEELCEDGEETCELCPPGWQLHRGRCYYFSEEAVSWDDSQRNCLAKKSQLLVIEDEIEMEFIDNKEKDTKYIWIGSKVEDEKKQRNLLGDPRVKENRLATSRIGTDENCAVYRKKNTIQMDNCQTLKKWICKKNATLLTL
ncbi:killer cell lectin-like receptor subfamily F member 1 isoform X2 [Anas acuta]|uniref:killer cell lectin-like receptor subfamily F member 1 isoform X2 n=1 Tax=Anas acuta TaxID=28680 RepID=UPI0035C93B72